MSVNTKITFTKLVDIIRRSIYQGNYAVTPFGRWKLDTNKNINLVVDYSNEDHCGSCAQYIHQKHSETTEYQKKNCALEQEYIYLLSNTQDHSK